MADSSATCKSLDGSVVSVKSDRSLDGTYTSVGVAELKNLGIKYQELTAGPRDLGETMAMDPHIALGMRLDEEYSFQGGRLRIGAGTQPVGSDGDEYWEQGPDGIGRPTPIRFGVWEGDAYSVHTQRYGGEANHLIAVFHEFEISETAEGVSCKPKDYPATTFIDGPRVLKDIPELGLLSIAQLTSTTAKRLPRHRGTPCEAASST